MLREFQDEIVKLREQLSLVSKGGDPGSLGLPTSKVIEVEQIIEVKDDKMLKKLEEKIKKEKEELKLKVA